MFKCVYFLVFWSEDYSETLFRIKSTSTFYKIPRGMKYADMAMLFPLVSDAINTALDVPGLRM